MPGRWGIRSYNKFLRTVKATFGLNHAQAQVAYRGFRGWLGRPATGADVKRHPVIVRREAKQAPRREAALRAVKTRAAKRAKAVPVEFAEIESFFGGEDFGEEQEY